MTNRGFNNSHPELQMGEVFLANISLGDYYSEWEHIVWKTKRMGEVAYSIDGRLVNGLRPVFAQRDELEKAGVDPEKD